MLCVPQNLTDRQTDRNNCLNIFKFIACFGVVFIHVPFPGILGKCLSHIFLFAVPYFFMIAGYYSYGCSVQKIRKRFIKILKILIFAIICWFGFKAVIHLCNNSLEEWISQIFIWKAPIKFFIFCTIDWAIPLWYLIAMVETYFVWMYIVKYKIESKATKFTYLLFILAAALSVFVDSYGMNWSYKINFILKAMPWFMFGYLVHEKYESKIHNIKNLELILLAIIGMIITLSAVLLNPSVDYNYLGVLLTAPSIFILVLKTVISKSVNLLNIQLKNCPCLYTYFIR